MIVALLGLPMMFLPFLDDSAADDEGEGGTDETDTGGSDTGLTDMGFIGMGAAGTGNDDAMGGETETGTEGAELLDAIDMADDRGASGGDDTVPDDTGADSFSRLSEVPETALVTDFDVDEDVLLVLQDPGEAQSVAEQRVEDDQVVLVLSNGAEVVLSGLQEAVSEAQISFVETDTTGTP